MAAESVSPTLPGTGGRGSAARAAPLTFLTHMICDPTRLPQRMSTARSQRPRVTRVAIVLGVLVLSLLAPSSAAAVRSEFFGIVQTATLDDQDLQGMEAAKLRTDRFQLNWGWVQPSQSSYKWDSADRFIGALASHGIRAVPSLWGNPSWVPGSASTPPIGGSASENAWRSFLKALVGRYGPGGAYWGTPYHQRYGASAKPLPIISWQVWNEPNLTKFFAPSPSPGKYAHLLQISHDAIKSKNPGAQIVLAGMPARLPDPHGSESAVARSRRNAGESAGSTRNRKSAPT